jgi:cobyrinic acid a,c-diamide synthase
MAGLLDVCTSFATRRMQLGYRAVTLLADGPLGSAGTRLKGHEFHYATVVGGDGSDSANNAFAKVDDAYSSPPVLGGSRRGLVTGSFFHVIARDASA